MNRWITGILCLAMIMLLSCKTGPAVNEQSFDPSADGTQVVLFHLEQRCESCNAVEQETLSVLNGEFEDELAAGTLKFLSFSFQSENGKKAAKHLKASGQSLYVVHGDSISNLTAPAFMFGMTHPERYRSALREELNKFVR